MNIIFFVLLCVFLIVEGASETKNSLRSRSVRDEIKLSPRSNVFESDKFIYENVKTTVPSSSIEVITIGPSKLSLLGGVPRAQFNSDWGVSIPIIVIGSFWGNDGALAQILKAFSVYSIYFCVPRFFGYRLILLDGPVRFEKLNFYPTDKFISFKRWAMTPIFWVCQILALTSNETYDMLMNDYGFPSHTTLTIIGIVSCFFTLGVFEFIENFVSHLFA